MATSIARLLQLVAMAIGVAATGFGVRRFCQHQVARRRQGANLMLGYLQTAESTQGLRIAFDMPAAVPTTRTVALRWAPGLPGTPRQARTIGLRVHSGRVGLGRVEAACSGTIPLAWALLAGIVAEFRAQVGRAMGFEGFQ